MNIHAIIISTMKCKYTKFITINDISDKINFNISISQPGVKIVSDLHYIKNIIFSPPMRLYSSLQHF